MTSEQINQLAQAIRPQKSESQKMTDMVFKAFSTLSLALIAWTLNTVNDLKTDVSELKINQQYVSKAIGELESFTDKPRFTSEDFERAVIPLTNQLNQNTSELNSRNSFMDKTDAKLQQLDMEIQLLKSKIE